MMTRHTLTALDQGRFQDRAWVEHLVDHFAGYYFKALEAYEQGAAALPAVWKLTFDLAGSPTTTVMEDLILGINAHINHDLPLAISDTLIPEWHVLPAARRAMRSADHMLINQIIAETMQPVQEQVVGQHARLAGAVTKVLGTLFDWEMDRIITGWRADVWAYAVRIAETSAPHEREGLRQSLEMTSLARVRLLLSARKVRNKAFGYPISWLHAKGLV